MDIVNLSERQFDLTILSKSLRPFAERAIKTISSAKKSAEMHVPEFIKPLSEFRNI